VTSERARQQHNEKPKGRPIPWCCPECGKKEVRLATVSHASQIKHDGRSYVVEVPRLRLPRCEACGELMFDNAADEQIAHALRDQLGLLSCSEIRRQREQLNEPASTGRVSRSGGGDHFPLGDRRTDAVEGNGPLSSRLLWVA
jgi:hypothetical protein